MSNMEAINATLMSQFNVDFNKAQSISETLRINYLAKGNDKKQFYIFFEKNFGKAHSLAGNNIDDFLGYMIGEA